MSAGGSADGAAAGAVDSMHLLVLGIVGGLLGIYLTAFLGETIGSLFAGLGAVCAIVWGADAIRRVASYGLGTGVPSIGYMSLSVGVILNCFCCFVSGSCFFPNATITIPA